MSKRNLAFLILVFSLFFVNKKAESQLQGNAERFRIMFYNCENYFDTYDDSLKRDDEFLPGGDKNWSYYRYLSKRNNIYKVIIAVGQWQAPDIVGLCEIENQHVLEDLVYNTPLSRIGYKIVHYESPDLRGIDVALLYNPERLEMISSEPIEIKFPNNPGHKTRDILYAKFQIDETELLHVFINHWPSRWSGQLESEPSRIYVATVLRKKVDSILNKNSLAKIVITGDFNDEPEDKSVSEYLNARHDFDNIAINNLYNLSFYLKNEKNVGSHKHKNEWGILDQIIVSGALLESKSGLETTLEDAHVFNPDFLLEEDRTYLGVKPFRTYIGYSFNNGFSDHLPVYIDLHKK